MADESARRKGLRLGIVALSALCGAAGVAAANWYLPNWRWGGAAIADRDPVLAPILRPVALRQGGVIVAQGDSLTYGAERPGGTLPAINGAGSLRVATPFPEALEKLLAGRATVRNLGYPGDTTEEGSIRWGRKAAGADVLILMYGTNDADPRGLRGGAVPLDEYRHALAEQVRDAGKATQVILLAPPPVGIRSINARVRPYREAARQVALTTGAMFVDPAQYLRSVPVPVQIDGLHLTAAANQAIAEGLAQLFMSEQR